MDTLLNAHDSEYVEEVAKEQDVRIVNRGETLSVSLPPNSKLEINYHAVNLELLFSQTPFLELSSISTVKPFRTEVLTAEATGGDFTVKKPS